MRGSKAKSLRRIARGLILSKGEDPGKDTGVYRQVKNCHAWVPSEHKDPDGNPLLMHVLNPGTIMHANPFRALYRALKTLTSLKGV